MELLRWTLEITQVCKDISKYSAIFKVIDFFEKADLQRVKPIKRNIGWKLNGAVLRSRHRNSSLKASRKCVQYNYPDSVELMDTPAVKKVPCADKRSYGAQDNKRRTHQSRKIYGSKRSPISIYRLPIEGKTSEEGLSVYNEEGGTFPDGMPSTKRSRHPRSPVKVSEYPSSEFSKEMYRRVFELIDGSDGSTPNNDTNSEDEKILTKDDAKELVV